MKFMLLDRSVLQQPDAKCDDAVAAPVGDIAIDRNGSVALMTAELRVTVGIQQPVRSKSLHISRSVFRGLPGEIVLLRHLLADRGEPAGNVVFEFLQLGTRLRSLAGSCG